MIERLYFRSPVAVQNLLFSLHGWRLARNRYTPAFHRHLAALQESEWWSGQAIREYQNRRFLECVQGAYASVPFYRWWWDVHGVSPRRIKSIDDIQALPVLDKHVVRKHQAELVSDAFPRRTLLKALTSGTTGTPLSVYLTRDAMAMQWAIWWRHKARFGLRLGHRHLVFGARVAVPESQLNPPYWRIDSFGNRVYLSVHHVSRRTVADIVKYLNSESFEFYTGYPSAMQALAAMIEEEGLQLQTRPRVVVLGSEEVTPQAEAVIRRVFGGRITDQYGMTEFAGNLSKCEVDRYHVDFECCHIETGAGSDGGAAPLLLTGLANPAMPFVRYEIGDGAMPGVGACACGRSSPWFHYVEGRRDDFIVTPDGRRLAGMNQIVKVCKGAEFIQVFQDSPNEVEFRVVPGSEYSEADEAALREEFAKRAGTGMRMTVRKVSEPQRSPSGKVRLVMSTLPASA